MIRSAVAFILCLSLGCMREDETTRLSSASGSSVTSAPFGSTADGDLINVFTLRNANGVTVRAINYGGIILSLEVPDREGRLDDVVLGYEHLEAYEERSPYFGSLIGRYANRIADGRFELDGRSYTLAVNNGPNHLHGGLRGFDKVLWQARPIRSQSGVGVVLAYTSPDGEEGYPGTLMTEVTYTLTDGDELHIDYLATTDAPTPVNLTQHSYFNLAGAGDRDILDHELTIHADRFTPVDETLIPTGELRPVLGTPLDFTVPRAVGESIHAQEDEQIAFGRGYDHNFVLNREGVHEGDLSLAARVFEPVSGRVLEVYTTEPGMQFYSGNFLDGSLTGKGGVAYHRRHGFCLETQHFPNSPNEPDFPSTILRPDETYRSKTIWAFTTQ